jgi:betaine-homocysteine S-methyltransferase
MSFESDPARSYEGHFGEKARLRDAGADVLGLNCLRNPQTILPLMRQMRAAVSGYLACQPVGYRTPAGKPDFTPPEFGPLDPCSSPATRWPHARGPRLGINFIGGCCGAVAIHIREWPMPSATQPTQPALAAEL